jgi:hypothetical protein
MKEYEMSNFSLTNFFLRIEIIHLPSTIFITQRQYIHKKLHNFGLEDCNPQNTPMNKGTKLLYDKRSPNVDGTMYREMVGSFIYLTNTHLDFFFQQGW